MVRSTESEAWHLKLGSGSDTDLLRCWTGSSLFPRPGNGVMSGVTVVGCDGAE